MKRDTAILAGSLALGLAIWLVWLSAAPAPKAVAKNEKALVPGVKQSPSSSPSSPDEEQNFLRTAIHGTTEEERSDAQWTLAANADVGFISELARKYAVSKSPEMAERLATIVSKVRSPDTAEALAALLRPDLPVTEPLQRAVLNALNEQATPFAVMTLARRLETAEGQDAELLASVLTHFDKPGLAQTLMKIAEGKQKGVSRLQTRVAAVEALKHHTGHETRVFLQALARGDDAELAIAAEKVLRQGTDPLQN